MNLKESKKRAAYNRTMTLTQSENEYYKNKLIKLTVTTPLDKITNKIINNSIFDVLDYLPDKFIDLMFIDPPYNLYKKFNAEEFKEMSEMKYEQWIDSWIGRMIRMLKPDASIYICSDWRSSNAVYNVASKYFKIQNRITWEREKGRGSEKNWKNCAEDIWFCTVSKDYKFNVDDVKLKRRVLAPYKNDNGEPKDWHEANNKNYRITYPSNIWTDITVPFWSMPENTDHPTQKPEKLLAKIILAGSNTGNFVFDPFIGSGTTAVVAKKLGRKYSGVELDEFYCCLTEKRLELAENDQSIQGYSDGVFWERNTLIEQRKTKR
ncbi:MAG TPA: site-specific DNA-methyltransferase [Ignavibacteria bacterium]|nr:site-specific DNA-methyltransferase [Ignavibacteria bacterium]